MVKLSDIDIGTKEAAVALLSAAITWYAKGPIEEKRKQEKLHDAELFGRTAAQYLAEEIKSKGLLGPETYRAIEELTSTLKEVKDGLEHYVGNK